MERKKHICIEHVDSRNGATIIYGRVVSGEQKGRLLGFPTANIAIHNDGLILKNEVSLCYVYIGTNKFPAIGTYLPFKKVYEVHILDRSGDCYGQEIRIELMATVRENRTFESFELLKEQIAKDVAYAKNFFQKQK